MDNEKNANNNLLNNEFSHKNDSNLLSDDELDKLVMESSDNEIEETETTIEDEEIIIPDENDTFETSVDDLDNNEKDYEDDFKGLDSILDSEDIDDTKVSEEEDINIDNLINENDDLEDLNIDDNEEESISLSGNELDSILDSADLIETEACNVPDMLEEIDNSDLQPLVSSKEDDVAIYSSLKAEMQAKEAKEAEEKTELLKKDVKTVLSYLDQLLDALPEEKIKEFAKSKEFDIYIKLFEELNIKIN